MKRLSASLLIGSLFVLSPATSYAATFAIPKDDEIYMTVPVDDDLYIFGRVVGIEEEVSGDLITAGGEINVDASVGKDLIIVGGALNIRGPVGDDLRAGAGEIRIMNTVKDDLLIAAGRVNIEKDAVVSGDVVIGGGEIFIDGIVEGNMIIYGGRVILKGTVEGDVTLNADDIRIDGIILGSSKLVAENIVLGDSALFDGDVEYWQKDGEIDFGEAIKGGTALFNADLKRTDVPEKVKDGAKVAWKAALAAMFGYTLFSAAFLIFLIILFTRTFFTDCAKRMAKAPGMSFLGGFLYFLLTPIAVFIFFITIIGIPISLYIFFAYVFSIIFAKPLTAMIIARWFEMLKKWKWGKPKFFFASVGVYIVLKIIGLVPFIGWLAIIVAICMAFGALLHTKWVKVRKIL